MTQQLLDNPVLDNPVLDNPVWHALTGPHAALAVGPGAARHYPRDVAPFSAIALPTAAAYADLAADLPPGVEARLFRPADEPVPVGWHAVSARPLVQMVLDAGAQGAVHWRAARWRRWLRQMRSPPSGLPMSLP